MRVPWKSPQCILCLQAPPQLTLEHVIPEALGGELCSELLCKACNSYLGHRLEALSAADPTVRIAVEKLAHKIPHVAARLRKGQSFTIHSDAGQERATLKRGNVQVKGRKADDGSLILPTSDARKALATMMAKEGIDAAQACRGLSRFDGAADNERVDLSPGIEAVKWGTTRVTLDLSGSKLLNPLAPVKIAYEFLALMVGEAICAPDVGLEAVRSALLSDEANDAHFTVERLISNKYEPFHGLCFEGNKPHAVVQIRLLGYLAYRVHFLTLRLGGPRWTYTHLLDTNEEFVKPLAG